MHSANNSYLRCVVVLSLEYVITAIFLKMQMYIASVSLPYNMGNRRSSEIQGTALGKCLWAWSCMYRSMPAGEAQSRHAFVGGTVSMWAR